MTRRPILEIGLLQDEFPILRRQYLSAEDLFLQPILVGDLLSTLKRYAVRDSMQIPAIVNLDQYIVCLHRFNNGNNQQFFLLYAICNSSTKEVLEGLRELANELKTYDHIISNWNVDTESLKNLNPIIDEFSFRFK